MSKCTFYSFVLQMIFATVLLATDNTHGQSNKHTPLKEIEVRLKLKEASLATAFKLLESKTGLKFAYIDSNIPKDQLLNLQGRQSMEDVLKNISKNTQLKFTRLGDRIMVSADPNPKGEPVVEEQIQMLDKVITGQVVDSESQQPLPGVNVLLKNSNVGTVTDIEGRYKLQVPEDTATIIFSFIGYVSEEVEVGNQSTIDLQLMPDIQSLSEIVVVGYGTQRKKDLTGSIAHLDMEGQEMKPVTSLVQALQGAAPGLNARMGSSAGDAGGISIRGKTSLSASDEPLLVVDGMIYYGNITDFNMNDIASIDVLKDASAAAVYGSRSANGVIAITTKQGKSEKPSFNFNMYYGMQDLANTDRTHVMNGDEYALRLVDYNYQQELNNWYKTNPTNTEGRPVRPDITDREVVASYLRTQEEQENYLAGNEIDWVDEVLRVAPIQSYNLSVSGSSEKTRYYLSSSYTDQKGIMENDQFTRLTFLSKLETDITEWFTLEFAPQYTHRDYSGVEASIGEAMGASPLGDKYDENGNYPPFIANESINYHPLGNLLISDETLRDNIRLAFKGKFDIPGVEGLKYEINYSKNYYFSHTYRYYPKGEAEGSKADGRGYKDQSTSSKYLLNNIVSYNKIFGDHRFDVTLLHSEEKLQGEGTVSTGTSFSSEKLGYNALENALIQEINTSAYEEFTRSFMGRISYILKDRYMLTGTIRRDGFSGFGAEKKWADFPSLSLGWVASEEAFLDNTAWLDYLKLRLSYGVNGNQGIGRYNSQAVMTTISTVFDGSTANGIYSGSLGNSELGWETTLTGNIGLDFEMLDGRLSGSVDAYNSETSDVLVQRSIPRITGNSSVWTNIGGIKNHGVEVSLSSINFNKGPFSWNTGVTFALNRNELTKLYDDVTEDLGNGWFVGESYYAIYGYETDGIWLENDLYEGNIIDGYYPGQFKIVDQNGDGNISAENDRKIVGNTSPNYRFSISNAFQYKNLSLSVFLNSIQGGNGFYMDSNTGALVAGGTDYAYRENRTAIRPYWTPENQVNNAPGMYYNPAIAPAVYQDKSFLRLQDVTLAYQLSATALQRLGLGSTKLYVSGQNLYTWTKWSGWDPDVGDYVMRSFVVGLNVNF